MKLCVDASLVIKWLLIEEGSDHALHLLESWKNNQITLFAPSLIDYEIGTVIRQKIIRGLLKEEHLYPTFDYYKRLHVSLIHLPDWISKAVSIAATLKQATVYDISYLLVAKENQIDFITADYKFYKTAHPLFSFVKYYEDCKSV